MKIYTLQYVADLHPCCPEDWIRELAAGRTGLTYTEVLNLPIPGHDLLWLLFRGPDMWLTVSALEKTVARCVRKHGEDAGLLGSEALVASFWLTQLKEVLTSGRTADSLDLILTCVRAASQAAILAVPEGEEGPYKYTARIEAAMAESRLQIQDFREAIAAP